MSGQKEEVKVLGGWFSPFPFRVELALKLKEISYEYVEQDLMNKSPLLVQLNPVHKKIPVLVHNGLPISESLVILEYVDDVWKHNPILPQHPYDRAIARFWAHFIDNEFTEVVRSVVLVSNEEEKKKQVEKAMGALKILEEELKQKGKKFFGGDKIGIVDITLSFLINWVDAIEDVSFVKIYDRQTFQFLDKWKIDFIEEVSCVNLNFPQKEKLVEHFKKFLSLISLAQN